MAVLSEGDRADEVAQLQRDLSAEREPCAVTKAALRAALDADDQWVDDNAASFNAAIPQPARGALTARQKARLLLRVVRRRFEVS